MQLVQRIAIASASITISLITIQANSAQAASLNLEPALTATGVNTSRSLFGLDGSGIKIGVISNSFNTATAFDQFGNPDTYATDIANGYLPSGVQVLQDAYGDPDATDEGRAMLELIHAVAPGASLAFYPVTTPATANNLLGSFGNAIQSLAAAGANIIVDDIGIVNGLGLPAEPNPPSGPINQVIKSVFDRGVSYFSSAGNDYPTSPIYGHRNNPDTFALGADYLGNDLTSPRDGFTLQGELEPFSSAGRSPFMKPDAVAPDGLDISFNLGGFSPIDRTTGFHSFFGTSGAAPFAAAVGALMLQADPNASPSQIYSALRDTAIQPPGLSGFNHDTGYGLIQADKAIAALEVKPKSVPEPTSLPVLLALGTLGVGLLLRRHLQQQVPFKAVGLGVATAGVAK